ncbi:MAG: hypothetical protein HZA78_11085 [Candidatus Schekmanbacteria bacterium]|nr:hypothetical protein [Candidatus Schekmanbacteria bacterium]
MKKTKKISLYLLFFGLIAFISYSYIQSRPKVLLKPPQKKVHIREPVKQQAALVKPAFKSPGLKINTQNKKPGLFLRPRKEILEDRIQESLDNNQIISCLPDMQILLPGQVPENAPDILNKKLTVNVEKLSIVQEIEKKIEIKQIANSRNRFKTENVIGTITPDGEGTEDYQLDFLLYPTLDEFTTNTRELKNKIEINSGVKINF